jgi:hypothetical protein
LDISAVPTPGVGLLNPSPADDDVVLGVLGEDGPNLEVAAQGGDAPFPDAPDSFGVPPSLHRPTANEPPVGSDLVLADLARVDLFLMQEALYRLGAFYLPCQVHARGILPRRQDRLPPLGHEDRP